MAKFKDLFCHQGTIEISLRLTIRLKLIIIIVKMEFKSWIKMKNQVLNQYAFGNSFKILSSVGKDKRIKIIQFCSEGQVLCFASPSGAHERFNNMV